MEKLYREQKLLSEQLARWRTNYKKDSKVRKTVSYLNRLLAKLEELSESFAASHRKILDVCEDLEHAYFEEAMQMTFEESCMDFQAELEELLPQSEGPPNQSVPASDSKKSDAEVRLPRIELPSFSGNYADWVPFKDLFESLIYNKTSLSSVEKLHYLKCSLNGEPLDLLKSFKVTANNLELAWKTLIERYNNPSAIISIHFKQLCSDETVSESASSIKNLLDKTMESVRLVEDMEVNNLWHALVVYLVVRRLPAPTRSLWEQEQATNGGLYFLDELQQFLKTRFRTLEASGSNTQVRRINAHHVGSQVECSACKEGHKLRSCPKFVNATQAQRFDMVKRYRLCLNCLSKGHMASNCPNTTKCFKCKGSHHTMLHREVNTSTEDRSQQSFPSTSAQPFIPSNSNDINSLNTIATGNVLLATAMVTIYGEHGTFTLRALLDQGSQASFLTEEAVQRIGLKKNPCDASVTGIGKASQMRTGGLVDASIQTLNNEYIRFQAYVLPKLTNHLPTRCMEFPHHVELDNIQLADPRFNIPGRIDLILGADVYGKLMLKNSKLLFGRLLLQQTKLGWILSGAAQQAEVPTICSFNVVVSEQQPVADLLEKFWKLEEAATTKMSCPEDVQCENFYCATTTRDDSGRFQVRLPFKSEELKHKLGESWRAAEMSFMSLERRFHRFPKLKEAYDNCINEYIDSGYVSVVNKSEDSTLNYYLPHHAIIKDSTTTHTRIVFDASRKSTSGLSLNDVLLTRPPIQNDITSVLLRWRFHQYAFVADIAKMYLQIGVHNEDRKFQRILWRFDPRDEMMVYQFNTVTFGVTSAPFLAIRTLQQLAKENEATWPMASKSIVNDFYVDDVLSGANNWSEAKHKVDELTESLRSGGFHLRKWVSNEPSILQSIPAGDKENLDELELGMDLEHKSLGILWHITSDSLSFRCNLSKEATLCTKRTVLSDIAKLYDPLGLIAPITIRAKCWMQQIWMRGLNWDEELPEEMTQRWRNLRRSLMVIVQIRIPRWITIDEKYTVDIHGFCDASQEAYAAAIYCVCRGQTTVKTQLMLAKTKVAPIKPATIPRLELCGAVLLSKAMKQLLITLHKQVEIQETHLWTDSEIVLSWLRGHPSRWTVFVSNRTCQIMENVPRIPWRHVSSESNPADLASRGVSVEHLINNSLWWNGPNWLSMPADQWPGIKDVKPTLLELKRNANIVSCIAHMTESFWDTLILKFSTYTRLIRVTAYCQRFGRALRILKQNPHDGHLTVQELNDATNLVILYVQGKEFASEIHFLKNDQPIPANSKLTKLNPFLDNDGILRLGGRLTYANMPFDERHPIILPRTGNFNRLLVQHIHQTTLHGGMQLMLATLRKKFWMIDARNIVKKYIHNCLNCYRTRAQTSTQLMGSLPFPRVNATRPFTHVGVDYCGPVSIKDRKGRGGRIHKGYIALFVCLSVKAIHIEVVNDLTTEAFLAAFRRFVSRRGLCTDVYSDCGTNFVGASTELLRIAKANYRISELTANENINWHFNPPASPHFGGLWEAGIKSMKSHLRKTLGNAILTYEELCTTTTQIEACLYSRPLCAVYDNSTEATALTPAHFLIGDTLLNALETNLLDTKENYLSRWQFTQRLSQMFWKRWSEEYLSRLQPRPKWFSRQSAPRIGDLCILKDERLPSYKWPLAKIIALHPGKDGLVRVVTVTRNGSDFKRNITRIALLPCNEH